MQRKRSFAVLTILIGISQISSLLFLFALLRLYSPSQIGAANYLLAISNIFNSFSTFKIENQIPFVSGLQAKRKVFYGSALLLGLCIALCLIIFSFLIASSLFYLHLIANPNKVVFYFFVPLIVLGLGLYQLQLSLTLAHFRSAHQGAIKMALVFSTIVFQIIFRSYGASGYLTGILFGYFSVLIIYSRSQLGVLMIFLSVALRFRKLYRIITMSMRHLYSSLSFSVIAGLASYVGSSCLIIFVYLNYSQRNSGLIGLALTLYAIPSALVGPALTRYFINSVSRSLNASGTRRIFRITVLAGFAVSFAYLCIIYLVPISFFGLFLPSQWLASLHFLRLFAWVLLFDFSFSSVSIFFYYSGLNKVDMFLQMILALAKLLPPLVAYFAGLSIEPFVQLYAILASMGYVIYAIFLVHHVALFSRSSPRIA